MAKVEFTGYLRYNLSWDDAWYPKIEFSRDGEYKTLSEAQRAIKLHCRQMIAHWRHIAKVASTQVPQDEPTNHVEVMKEVKDGD